MEKLEKLVVEKSSSTVEKAYTVIPELKFTDKMLQDPTPMTFTYKQLFDMFVEVSETKPAV